jgi:acetylglutamate kinase
MRTPQRLLFSSPAADSGVARARVGGGGAMPAVDEVVSSKGPIGLGYDGSDKPSSAAAAQLSFREAPSLRETLSASDRSLVAQLLSHFKQTAEVRQYIRYYGNVVGHRFAVIKVSGDGLRDEEDYTQVASALSFLLRIGLVPIVVHGAGLFSGRKSEAIATATAAGAGAEALVNIAYDHLTTSNAALVAALRREGVDAVPLTADVFRASRDDDAEGELAGAVGKIRAVSTEHITAAVRAGSVPIVSATATDAAGKHLTFSTQAATVALARVVQPLKVIWLRPEGGLRTGDNRVVGSVDLCRDAPHLVSGLPEPELHADASAEEFDCGSSAITDEEEAAAAAAAKAEICHEELHLCKADAASLVELASFHDVLKEPGATVSVTAPEHLAAELFTHRGEGTLIARGERVFSHASLLTLDVPRLNALIGAAFGAPLPEGYLEGLERAGRLDRVYISENYRAAAVVLHAPDVGDGVHYLDKFAVDPSAQGDKLGEVLWRSMISRERRLFWRSRATNRVNTWYYEQSHGCVKAAAPVGGLAWTIFWRHLSDREYERAVGWALSQPPTFPHSKDVPDAAERGTHPAAQPQLL